MSTAQRNRRIKACTNMSDALRSAAAYMTSMADGMDLLKALEQKDPKEKKPSGTDTPPAALAGSPAVGAGGAPPASPAGPSGKRGPMSKSDEEKLKQLVAEHGPGKADEIAKAMGRSEKAVAKHIARLAATGGLIAPEGDLLVQPVVAEAAAAEGDASKKKKKKKKRDREEAAASEAPSQAPADGESPKKKKKKNKKKKDKKDEDSE